jgi:hypothetical protein
MDAEPPSGLSSVTEAGPDCKDDVKLPKPDKGAKHVMVKSKLDEGGSASSDSDDDDDSDDDSSGDIDIDADTAQKLMALEHELQTASSYEKYLEVGLHNCSPSAGFRYRCVPNHLAQAFFVNPHGSTRPYAII